MTALTLAEQTSWPDAAMVIALFAVIGFIAWLGSKR